MLIRRGEIFPKVINMVSVDDSYRPEHIIIFQTIMRMYAPAAQIRRGATFVKLESLLEELSSSIPGLNILELQDETVDELLTLVRPLCTDKAKAPVVCLDYLKIVPRIANRQSRASTRQFARSRSFSAPQTRRLSS